MPKTRIPGTTLPAPHRGRIRPVTVHIPDDLAEQVAKEVAAELRKRLKAGRDAEGDHQRLSPETIERRRRRPGGGGSRPFNDTGRLVSGLRVRTDGRGRARVTVPADRQKAAAALAKQGRPVVDVVEEAVDRAFKRVLGKVFR